METGVVEKERPMVPLRRTEGEGKIRYLCSRDTSLKITGNGVGGDDRIVWDRRFPEMIKDAKDKFYQLVDQGYMAFELLPNGKTGSRITEFDPNLEEVIMVAPVRGG